MKFKEFIKKYPLIPVFVILFVLVWVVYGINEIMYKASNDASQSSFEEISSSVFETVSEEQVSGNLISNNEVSSNEVSSNELSEEEKAFLLAQQQLEAQQREKELAEEERKKRIQDFYNNCGNKDYYEPLLEQKPDFNALWELNDEVVAYLLIPDTKMDYPILQSEDNGFYLNHNFNKKKGHTGCLYIENFNSPEMNDPIAVIYGHDMLNDSMFGQLNKYLNGSYRKEHPYIFIYTPSEVQVYEVALSSVVEDVHLYDVLGDFTPIDEETMYFESFRGDEPEMLYKLFKEKGISHSNTYITDEPFTANDQLVVLSTCFRTGTRFIVVGRKIV